MHTRESNVQYNYIECSATIKIANKRDVETETL